MLAHSHGPAAPRSTPVVLLAHFIVLPHMDTKPLVSSLHISFHYIEQTSPCPITGMKVVLTKKKRRKSGGDPDAQRQISAITRIFYHRLALLGNSWKMQEVRF